MPDLQVLYDPNLQVAAIVDLDTNMGWGPMCPGPQGAELLQSFIDGMPFDITILTQEQARDIFLSVFREQATEAITSPGATVDSSLESPVDPVATDSALATATAVASAGAPPPEQSSDTDMAADTGEAAAVTTDPTVARTINVGQPNTGQASDADAVGPNCALCNFSGTGSNNPQCPACHGTGHLAVT